MLAAGARFTAVTPYLTVPLNLFVMPAAGARFTAVNAVVATATVLLF
jgi:hypothetical protein